MAETFTYLEDPRILNVPTPVDRYVIPVIPLYTWFYTSQVVAWNFFHQQYILGFMTPKRLMKLRFRIFPTCDEWDWNIYLHLGSIFDGKCK